MKKLDRPLTRALVLVSLIGLTTSCIQKPRMAYSNESVAELKETKELMRVLYATLSPVWVLADKDKLTAADFEVMAEATHRVEAVSDALKTNMAERYKGGFADRADTLGKFNLALRESAGNKDEPGSRAAIEGINDSCSGCHGAFR